MAFSYHLLTATGNILPATYGLTVTASQPGYTPLTVTFQIVVQPVPATGDTLRTLTELLTVTWRDGQAARQLTAQDCRDTIISLALQRGDFSRLPRLQAAALSGRAWIDALGTVRVNLGGVVAPLTSARITAAGSFSANALRRMAARSTISGASIWTATPVPAAQPVPGPPVNLSVPSVGTTTETVSFQPPTAGGLLDRGFYQVEYIKSGARTTLGGAGRFTATPA